MASDAFEQRRKALEGAFFRVRDAALAERLRERGERDDALDALARACGVEDEAVTAPLLSCGVGAESLAALMLAPLVVVAWADTSLTALERLELLAHARDLGVDAATPTGQLLQRWMEQAPGPELLEAWVGYAQHVAASLDRPQREIVAREVLRTARAVAGADGGVLRIGRRISPAERRVLDRLERAFEVEPSRA